MSSRRMISKFTRYPSSRKKICSGSRSIWNTARSGMPVSKEYEDALHLLSNIDREHVIFGEGEGFELVFEKPCVMGECVDYVVTSRGHYLHQDEDGGIVAPTEITMGNYPNPLQSRNNHLVQLAGKGNRGDRRVQHQGPEGTYPDSRSTGGRSSYGNMER